MLEKVEKEVGSGVLHFRDGDLIYRVIVSESAPAGWHIEEVECRHCDGTGAVSQRGGIEYGGACNFCEGSGKMNRYRRKNEKDSV